MVVNIFLYFNGHAGQQVANARKKADYTIIRELGQGDMANDWNQMNQALDWVGWPGVSIGIDLKPFRRAEVC